METDARDTLSDHQFMAEALRLAKLGRYTTHPNPNVGCVIVQNGKIVGSGYHYQAGQPHAEVFALREAGDRAVNATAYVTLEPCSHQGRTPPCAQALISARLARVVIAMKDPNPQVAGQGIAELKVAGIEIKTGVCEAEARSLNSGYLSVHERGRPWVRLKIAASLDGRTAMASGESQWITGPEARQDVQHWRARSSAVMTGVGTVLHDDPQLTVRLNRVQLPKAKDVSGNGVRQPARIILDTHLRTPETAKLFQQPGTILLVTGSQDQAKVNALTSKGAEILFDSAHGQRIDFAVLWRQLSDYSLGDIWVEAGSTLGGALLAGDWVDELILYYAPLIMGDTARGMFSLPQLTTLAEARKMQLSDIRQIGEDWRMIAVPKPRLSD